MARSPFPTGDGFGRNVSESLPGINVGAPAAGAAGALADAAQRVGRQVEKMAERAWTREGQQDAARVIGAASLTGNQPRIREGQGVDDQAYNTVVREHLLTQRQTAWIEGADKVELENPDSEIRWAEALQAHDAAFTPTGDPELDTRFANFRTVQRMQRLGRVREGQERARQATVRGAFVDAASVGRTTLGQAAVNAGFDDAGAQLMGVSLGQFAQTLARFGPREAFTVGGIEFAADPTRAGVMSPEALAQTFDAGRREAQMAWISQAAERAPDAASKRAFVGQVQERWAAGDPAFAGLDAGDFDRLTTRLEGVADRAATDEAAAMRAAGERARDLLTAGEYGDDVDPAELREAGTMSGDVGLMAQIEFALTHGFEATPASLRAAMNAGGAVGAGFDGWVNFLLDDLEGPGLVADDNGAGRAQWGITERSHQAAWADGRIDRAEARAIYRDYWDQIGGDRLPAELASAAASAAVVNGPGKANEWLRAAGGDVERFLDLEIEFQRGLARSNPAKYGGSLQGWERRNGLNRARSRQIVAQRRAADGYASDPIGYARGNGRRQPLATVAEMTPADLFDGDARAVGEFLRARRATGQELARRDGVPFAMFASEEVAAIKERIDREPRAIVTLARRAGYALGNDGARDLFRELDRAGVGGGDLLLATLSLEPMASGFVAAALDGRELKAQGAPSPDFGSGEEDIAAAARARASAFAAQPEVLAAAVQVATMAAWADQARGNLRSASYYLNGALGATQSNGRRFGGVTFVNGARTIAPSWLEADRLDEALDVAARGWVAADRGPVYANGRPIPGTRLSRMQLRAMPNGRYRLVDPGTGEYVNGRSGRAFEFDIEREAFRSELARRMPQSVRVR